MPNDPIVEPDELPSLGNFHLIDVREPSAFLEHHPAAAVRWAPPLNVRF